VGRCPWAQPYSNDEDGNQGYTYEEELTPIVFIPSLKIFEYDSDLPEELRKAIDESFELFWTDPSSCCNKIRIVIELIMNDQKIQREIKYR
jgi:hypothetical protein